MQYQKNSAEHSAAGGTLMASIHNILMFSKNIFHSNLANNIPLMPSVHANMSTFLQIWPTFTQNAIKELQK